MGDTLRARLWLPGDAAKDDAAPTAGQVKVCINTNESRVDKVEAANAHNEKVSDIENLPEHLIAYSDGSLFEDKESGTRSVGYGVVGYYRGEERFTRVGPMGSKSEIYGVEMAGLAWAACNALTYTGSHSQIRHLHFFADNRDTPARRALPPRLSRAHEQ
ncbi:hypothetical protein B0H17DRAFT_1137277 [Mycena rosella]|uniref:RNase H type-1 domain-containing protein n=1 Tax=Mycena rosella TaxID=1033263 RepID=A0AAD7GB08_MYCRO|nr:hypothetical protein B0H17DRAFT_1137277 [Mycena rosella]